MKKKYLVLFLLILFLTSGCNSKIKNKQEQITKEIEQAIEDTENVSIMEITTAFNYINDNYETLKKNSAEQ